MKPTETVANLTFSNGAPSMELPVYGGTIGPDVIDIRKLYGETGMFTEGWWLWPIGRYVERHALEKPAETLSFLHAFTHHEF